MTKEEFYDGIPGVCGHVMRDCDPDNPEVWWMADLMVAIAALESAHGTKPAGKCNLIGYHWIDGQEWSFRWHIARETGSGNEVRYRIFDSYYDCFVALRYLLRRSSIYDNAREQYNIRSLDTQARFIEAFSQKYCSGDQPNHANQVLAIFEPRMGEKNVFTKPSR